MGVSQGYSSIVTNGLVFAYDVADTRNSYLGRPTTNVNTHPLYIYNNVPSSISSTLTATSDTYRGATIYKQTLTALDGSGAGWLSGGNNPGVGVYTYPGGGGNANQYSGHSIFFKTTVPMAGCPCYTNYSNIGGWQSSCNIEDMGDGWFRPYVLWYNTSTQSDGKFWAINPLSTSVGQTITIYWAGQFREDLNSTTISQFVNGSRSTSQAVTDLSSTKNILTTNNDPFSTPAINPKLNFDGTDDYINIPHNSAISPSTGYISVEAVFNAASAGSENGSIIYNKENEYEMSAGGGYISYAFRPNWAWVGSTAFNTNQWYHTMLTYDQSYQRLYVNGIEVYSAALSGAIGNVYSEALRIGARGGNGAAYGFFNGQIPVVKVYNRALSASEVLQNYNHYKTRYNLPGIVYNYNEGTRADLYTGYWNNSTTYTMADFGGIPNVTAHGFSSGPVTYTLTLGDLPTHTKVRYKVYWHLVDSLDNETNQLFIMNSGGGETEILRFTKQYNLTPSISIAASPGTYTWSGSKTYTYRPWAGGAYNADGYIIVDSGWVNHTASSFTARHVMGADQAQADEAEYLSHVEVQLFG